MFRDVLIKEQARQDLARSVLPSRFGVAHTGPAALSAFVVVVVVVVVVVEPAYTGAESGAVRIASLQEFCCHNHSLAKITRGQHGITTRLSLKK
jgi:hypothetical protein